MQSTNISQYRAMFNFCHVYVYVNVHEYGYLFRCMHGPLNESD